MNRFSRRAVGAVRALLPLLLAACAREASGPAAVPGDSLRIAVAAARTPGTQAYFDGVQLAVDHLNARRPPASPPFALRLPPIEQPTQVAVAAAFRDDPEVIGVVGHTGSAQMLEAAPIYGDVEHGGRDAVVTISPTATNPTITRSSPWVFRVCPTDRDGARALARFATDSLGARRVAVVYRNDLFGRGFTRALAPALAERGTRLLERDPYLAGITEWDAYAARLARRSAEVLVVAGGAADAAEIIRAVRRAGIRPTVLGTDDVAGIEADSGAAREFRGVRYTAFYRADRARSPDERAFVAEFRQRFGKDPDHRAALSYDAAMLIGLAALEEGPDRTRIRDRIARVGRDAPAHAGITGPIRFDEWGDAVDKPVLIAEVRP